jgi:outer membrane receptor protein involved in Fe transport
MRFIKLQSAALALSLFAAAGLVVLAPAPAAFAQTAVTGAISGVVADSTGGVVPGATVTVVNTGTNATLTLTTNAQGQYTVPQLAPGTYAVSASSSGLQSVTTQVTVLVGTTIPANITVTPTGNKTVIEVSASTLPLVDTQNVALATTFNEQQIQNLPTPGGDVTTVAFTAPGVVVNAGGSYGNFSSDGLPGISNLFVLNGFDNQDPFLNLNNSGSSNLSLGQGELAEATVVQNAYNSQYGRAAGAILNYTTKSGTNSFHGEAMYDYNGTVLNANGWFNNFTDTPRPHAVSNEWALNGGGPIIKDKLFFFADYEGLHYVLPASGYVSLPSSEYESYTMANIPTAADSIYSQMFNLYNNAPSYASATPVPTVSGASSANPGGGCGSELSGATTPDGSVLGQSASCALSAYASANNINVEWLFTGRVDWNISDKHKIYGRYKMDHGSQPTATSYINPAFNTVSSQPEYEGQFNDTYSINSNLINTAVVAANWYTAYFGPSSVSASQAVLPFWAYFNVGADGSGTSQVSGLSNLGVPGYFPQGRNVTQYQLEDDLNWTHGRHNFKFGANFRRDLVSDYDQQEYTAFPFLFVYSLSDIAQGALCSSGSNWCDADFFQQAFVNSTTAHLALYNIGVYVQDDWQVSPRLKLTIGARVDRTGNPLCHSGCFSLYSGSFPNSAASLNTPYSTLVNDTNWHPFNSVDTLDFQPRFGFNYQLDEKTVVRGGAGLFADLYPAGFLDSAIQNFPNYNLETIYSGVIAGGGSGSLYGNATAGNTAIQSGYSTGGTATSINNALTALGIPFTPPSINGIFPHTLHEPEYLEFSLQLQRQFSKSDGISLTYAGNYGYNELIQNPFVNGSSGTFDNATGTWGGATGFGGYGATPADPSFGQVNAYTNAAHSNYNGATVTYTHQGQGLTSHISYTYSHALDMISNGGIGEYYNGSSVTKQLTPQLGYGNLNYSNADYDIRNNLVGDIVYEEPLKFQNKFLNYAAAGWLTSAKIYYRSGEPYSVDNNNVIGAYPNLAAINNTQGLTTLMPEALTSQLTNTCGSNPKAAVSTPCLDSTQYSADQTTFGNVRRNAFFGPHYADFDASLSKKFYQRESFSFALGAQAYNIFNHPNFSNPNTELGTSSFGTITSVQAPPTSPYGSFQSAAVTQRVLVVTGKITF